MILFEGHLLLARANPDVVFITLPTELHKMCILPGQIGLKIILANRRFGSTPSEEQIQGDYDFHNIIKVIGMKHRLPTRFVLPTTLDLDRKLFVQDLATRAWNLSVAAYYKSKGVPWKLAELEAGTCYAGISFYRECSPEGKQSMRARARWKCLLVLFSPKGERVIGFSCRSEKTRKESGGMTCFCCS